MVRIATVGDLHCGSQDTHRIRAQFARVAADADLLLLAGDLTNHGTPDEMRVLAAQLAHIPIPVVAIFGNHDVHAEREASARTLLEAANVIVLDHEVARFEFAGTTIGIAGAKGFCGGFKGGCASSFGEPEMRVFLGVTTRAADFFKSALDALDTDLRIALMHYAPIAETLLGERWELFPFLGAYQLGEAIDAAGCDLALHGHAHRGTECGTTPGGIPVRNVAQAVLRAPYRVIALEPKGRPAPSLERVVPAAATIPLLAG